MLKTTSTNPEFESIALEYLRRHPEIPHEWKKITDVSGGRTDLICWPGTKDEVFASLTDYQITIGTRSSSEDFEKFGRDLSDKALATEAWSRMQDLIER